MTQVFDEESGVVTSVTVIEAGPCPVVAVRTPDADGYEAVQLAYEPVADRKISKPERGHLAKNGVDGAYRHLVEFRGPLLGRGAGRERHGRDLPARRQGEGRGHRRSARASRARSSATASIAARRRTARTTSASRARSARRATPSRVFKGMKMAGQMGGKRVTQVGLTVHAVDAERNLLLVKGAVPGPKNGIVEIREDVANGRAQGTRARRRRTKDVSLDEAVFGAEVKPHLVHEAVRAELNAQRQGTRAAKSRGLVSGGRAKPWRQKGTGRARQGTIRAPQFTGGGVAFPPSPRRLRREGEQEGVEGRAALARCRDHAQAGTIGARRRARRSTRRRRSRPPSCSPTGARTRRRSSSSARTRRALAKSFRNLDRVLVTVPSELEVDAGRVGALAARQRRLRSTRVQGRAAS